MAEATARAPQQRQANPFGLVLLGHVVGAALLWWAVPAPDSTVIYNSEFERWAWLAGTLGGVFVVVAAAWHRSLKSALVASLGVVVAGAVELAMFVAWIVSHSQ